MGGGGAPQGHGVHTHRKAGLLHITTHVSHQHIGHLICAYVHMCSVEEAARFYELQQGVGVEVRVCVYGFYCNMVEAIMPHYSTTCAYASGSVPSGGTGGSKSICFTVQGESGSRSEYL